MGRNREVDLIPLKFTKMLEPTLSSGYHGVFSCTRDIRYPYRKKKICFLSWASSYIHLFWVDLGVVQGDRISSFLGEILFWFCEEFLLKLSFKFPSPGPASPSWIFWILPLFVWTTFDFDFSQRFSVNCQNLCCQSTDSQSSVVISLGAICLHHLTIENEIRCTFCGIFTLATSGNGRMDISAVFSSQVWP